MTMDETDHARARTDEFFTRLSLRRMKMVVGDDEEPMSAADVLAAIIEMP